MHFSQICSHFIKDFFIYEEIYVIRRGGIVNYYLSSANKFGGQTTVYLTFFPAIWFLLNYSSPQTANEGPVRIQCKCLVPIYVFLEMKLRSAHGLVISNTEI
jgi:hypothetical protein